MNSEVLKKLKSAMSQTLINYYSKVIGLTITILCLMLVLGDQSDVCEVRGAKLHIL